MNEQRKHHIEVTLTISYDGAPIAMQTKTVPAPAIDDTEHLEPEYLGDLEDIDIEGLFQD